ncbi:phosphatidylserine decarboxylase [Sulfurovum sp. TSL1]|uniref:phosphatidylserine decarboxylase n=1 Tax=Sulfurovum sp. TSL1 TaxID=2826994 RepID=UPI001CC42279|nr:phosphatidylserine decarboxylase [Sulfurovum sp. TSL1]GIT97958.1 phosphatidylserine decarboxylase proenzyme [Sulfurovum sp. TSL1]
MAKHFTSILSSAFGKFASKAFPSPIQNFINKGYVKLMGLDMSEFKEPSAYPTLNKLFTRAFETPRALPEEKDALISGVDALITDAGKIKEGKAYQIKGMSYSIEKLFGPYHQEAASMVEGGEFINFYLSPKDYHRYHMPMRLKVRSLTHIPGKHYPVNFPLLRHKVDLFIENERVVIECEDEKGRTQVLVLVAALNVGQMVVTFEEKVRTNSEIRESVHYEYEEFWVDRGEFYGWFEMGSTILTFSEKGSIFPEVAINQKVKFTDILGKVL